MKSLEETDVPKNEPGNSADSSFVNILARSNAFKKSFFPTDREVFVDSNYPLILLNDTNTFLPFRHNIISPPSERKDLSNQTLLENEYHPHDKKEIFRRQKTFRQISNIISNSRNSSQSDVNIKAESEKMCSKSITVQEYSEKEENEVDIFQVEDKTLLMINARKAWLRGILDSKYWNIVIAVCILYALFAQDICVAFFTRKADLGFDVVSLMTIITFSIEILLTSYAKKEYIGSFFMVLDVISTLSIFLDIDFLTGSLFSNGNHQSARAAKTSIATRIGTRAGGIMRIVRLIRLVKLYKQITRERSANEMHKNSQNSRKIYPDVLADVDSPKSEQQKEKDFNHIPFERKRTFGQSPEIKRSPFPKIGRSSFFSNNSFIRREKDNEETHSINGKTPGDETVKSADRVGDGQEEVIVSVDRGHKRRFSKLSIVSTAAPNQFAQKEVLKESRVGKKLSDLTMKRVIIIVLALLLFIPFFQADFWFDVANSQTFQMTLIANLIDNPDTSFQATDTVMDSFINSQANRKPPLVYFRNNETILYQNSKVDLDDLRTYETQTITIMTQSQGELTSVVSLRSRKQLDAILSLIRTFFISCVLTFGAYYFNKDARDLILQPLERILQKVNRIAKNPLAAKDEQLILETNNGFENETIHIENAVVKIGGLLALGFGDAGSAIVGQNIAKSGDINPMLPGKKKAAIYGFCDIRNFTDATEVLQEDVMVFVNSIADVVHTTVDKYAGAANKNIGDAFLLVWKMPDDAYVDPEGHLEASMNMNKMTQNVADCAVISFLKIYAKINRDPVILQYKDHPGLNARLPNYKVKMGFGLHVGWAIEGAIGSEFKIDASYLSPNVNMSSRLEAVTKQYGVPLLFSGELFDLLSFPLQERSRRIDIVTVKGSIKPIELYTIDVDIEGMEPSKDKSSIPHEFKKLRQKLKKASIKGMVDNGNIFNLLETDKELVYMLRNDNEEFNNTFDTGFLAYIDGDWAMAKKKFEACLLIKADDGPTKNLMQFMAEQDFIAPENWEGFHVLTEK